MYASKKKDKIQLKQTDDITKRNCQKNFQTSKVHFTMVMKMIMTMRVIMKIMNSSSYWRVLLIVATKIASPILQILQKLINDFAVCKHQKQCSRTLLLAEVVFHGFGNQNYIFQKRTTLFVRSTQSMQHFYFILH